MPTTSTEVNGADWISCKGYMPNGAKIVSIKIMSITGLPNGITWYCDKESCSYKGKETGCITLEGTALEKGTYDVTVNLKGVGSLFGIQRNYDCLIETLSIVVN